jgi:hypothetical protein
MSTEKVPLPPGVPYAEQQYVALMHENGYVDLDADEEATLARAIERELQRDELQRGELRRGEFQRDET